MATERYRDTLALVGEVMSALELTAFGPALAGALRRAVPSDWITLIARAPQPADRWALMQPLPPAHLWERLPGSPDPWTEIYAPLGAAEQFAFALPARPDRTLEITLSRRAGGGAFTAGERALLEEARPHLTQAYRNVLLHEELRTAEVDPIELGLTPREAEIIQLARRGLSNQAAADAVGLSVRTVQKHLERSYRKLGVGSRTEAIARLDGR